MNKFSFSRVYGDTTIVIETTNVDLVAPELVCLFQDFMIACGYDPETVEEVCNEEKDQVPVARRRNG